MEGVYGSDQADREDLLRQGQNLIAEAYDRRLANTVAAAVDGTVYFQLVPLLANDLITNILLGVTTAGVAITVSKVGLFDKTGARLAISADLGTAWQSTGPKVNPLTSPYTVLSRDNYYLAMLVKATTTMPQFARCNSNTQMISAIAPGLINAASLAAQTDIPATASITTASASFWLGCN